MTTATIERSTLDAHTHAPPARSLQQRLAALDRANKVRTYRAALKRDIGQGAGPSISELLRNGGEDERLATMKVFDLLLALPRVGRVKANTILGRARVSPSKTLAGLSDRQRAELIRAFGVFPSTERLRRS